MGYAFEITDLDIQAAFECLGIKVDDARASDVLTDIDGDRAEGAALNADDMDDQADYAIKDIRNQLVELGHADGIVAEWVGLHYQKNFAAEGNQSKSEWRSRYIESLQESDRLEATPTPAASFG